MKEFLPKHETIISTWFKPVGEKPKQGDIIPHQKQVGLIYFYNQHWINGELFYQKIEISKEMILDLANKINEIENQVIDMPFDELPF